MNFKKISKTLVITVLVIFAIIGMTFSGVFVAMKMGWTNVRGTISERNKSLTDNTGNRILPSTPLNPYEWQKSEEWAVMKAAFTRDQKIINKAAFDAGVSPRTLLGGVIGEQFRFFSNRRETFKSYFEPLKILATLSNFSYGIAGLKPDTVARIDDNLKNKDSVFYLGEKMENVITYDEGADMEKVRFERITDTKDPYYSYLYVGLFMRQVSAQWGKKGYDISQDPGILSTLYNLGFNRSIPKSNAVPGGAAININGKEYSFGELGEEFYYSNELLEEFK